MNLSLVKPQIPSRGRAQCARTSGTGNCDKPPAAASSFSFTTHPRGRPNQSHEEERPFHSSSTEKRPRYYHQSSRLQGTETFPIACTEVLSKADIGKFLPLGRYDAAGWVLLKRPLPSPDCRDLFSPAHTILCTRPMSVHWADFQQGTSTRLPPSCASSVAA